jgi:hypothetical protein
MPVAVDIAGGLPTGGSGLGKDYGPVGKLNLLGAGAPLGTHQPHGVPRNALPSRASIRASGPETIGIIMVGRKAIG